MDRAKIEEGVRLILEGVGEDPGREGLVKTPERVAKMYEEVFACLTEIRRSISKPRSTSTTRKWFSCATSPSIPCASITFFLFTAKRTLRIFRTESCGDLAAGENGRGFARRLQLQEQLTGQIADALMNELKAKGAAVVIEAEHMCMTMRGK
mgnify:CR=1 FL=1